jgi:hypothetical protein
MSLKHNLSCAFDSELYEDSTIMLMVTTEFKPHKDIYTVCNSQRKYLSLVYLCRQM